MIKEKLIVANVKCSGCAATITEKINAIEGVANAYVIVDEDTIELSYDNPAVREAVVTKLHNLGYPEATEENGLLLQVKSYASCMAGRIKTKLN